MPEHENLGKVSRNPFSPSFGVRPNNLVGRESLLADVGGGLATGPRSERYTSLLLGTRGSGKTVLLKEIEDLASQDGWLVLKLDASTKGLPDRITQALHAAEELYDLDFRTEHKSELSGLSAAGFGWAKTVFQ